MKHNLAMKLKDLLPLKIRVIMGKGSRRLRYAALVLMPGKKWADKLCTVCDRNIRGFVHGGVLCPYCAFFPRHRALAPLVGRWVDSAKGSMKLMHVAPDACMRQGLIYNASLTYLGIDRFTPGHYYPPDTIHGDIENLDIDSNSQDLIICLHVLEHVDNDRQAVREMARVLKPGGIAIMAFPFREGQPTYEDPTIIDPMERAAAFGQWDHLRVFGEDVADRIMQSGFLVTKITSKDIWSSEEVSRWGLLPEEVFFFCRKPGVESSLSDVCLQ